jgi:hypothetical protein
VLIEMLVEPNAVRRSGEHPRERRLAADERITPEVIAV